MSLPHGYKHPSLSRARKIVHSVLGFCTRIPCDVYRLIKNPLQLLHDERLVEMKAVDVSPKCLLQEIHLSSLPVSPYCSYFLLRRLPQGPTVPAGRVTFSSGADSLPSQLVRRETFPQVAWALPLDPRRSRVLNTRCLFVLTNCTTRGKPTIPHNSNSTNVTKGVDTQHHNVASRRFA